jgi:hypothetical protein
MPTGTERPSVVWRTLSARGTQLEHLNDRFYLRAATSIASRVQVRDLAALLRDEVEGQPIRGGRDGERGRRGRRGRVVL